VVSSHILAELQDYCSEMLIIEDGLIAGDGPVKVKDVARPRYIVEIATARSDLREFLDARPGVDVIEADQYHALITHPVSAASRTRLIRELLAAGFEVSGFGESTRALEDAYFSQVKR
jgi:ABC-type multidrug transport system, ATPase component